MPGIAVIDFEPSWTPVPTVVMKAGVGSTVTALSFRAAPMSCNGPHSRSPKAAA